MTGYTKLFSSILDSTVWAEPLPTRVVWIAMLAMCDQDGVVWARAPGIAKRAGVTREECDRALATFAAPDPDSRTSAHDGRRAVETDDGWLILNYEIYRDRASAAEKAEKNAARQARWRARQKKAGDQVVTPRNAVSRGVTRITHSSAAATPSATAEAVDAEPATAAPAASDKSDLVWLCSLAETKSRGEIEPSTLLRRGPHRDAAEALFVMAERAAKRRSIGTRQLVEAVFSRWLTPERARIRKGWIVALHDDWPAQLLELDDEIQRQAVLAGDAANA